jgi:hypothetical protein
MAESAPPQRACPVRMYEIARRRAGRRPPRAHAEPHLLSRRALPFDHLVGAGEEGWRNVEPKGFGSPQIHDHFEFRGLLNRYIAGLSPLKNPIDQDCGTAEHHLEVYPVAKQSAASGKLREADGGKSLG